MSVVASSSEVGHRDEAVERQGPQGRETTLCGSVMVGPNPLKLRK